MGCYYDILKKANKEDEEEDRSDEVMSTTRQWVDSDKTDIGDQTGSGLSLLKSSFMVGGGYRF